MKLRERAFAGALLIAGGLVTAGVALVSAPGAYVVAGIGVGLWSWLVLSE